MNRADATLSYQPGSVFIDWDTRASSSIPVNDANTESSPSYVIHGVRLGAPEIGAGTVRFSPHVGIMNLFDADYATASGYGTYGRVAYGGVRVGIGLLERFVGDGLAKALKLR